MHAPREETWKDKFKRSPYFLGSLIFHAIIFLLIGSVVIFDAVFPKAEFESASYIMGGGDPGPAPPQGVAEATPENTQTEQTVQVPQNSASSSANDLISVESADPTSFSVPVSTQISNSVDTSLTKNVTQQVAANATAVASASFGARTSAIKGTMSKWGSGGGGGGGSGPAGTGRNVQAEFVCYLAKVEGLNSKLILFDENRNESGPIRNLMRVINSWSQGRIKAKLDTRPIDMASSELLDKAPPFVYFTGSRDFTLTATEVENMRRYLIAGGCIWGDSGLAGARSRFDIAFRREMKRVIPDADKQFEVLPNNHPIFGGDKSFFQLKGAPAGMNYRQEAVEAIKIDGEIAVIYTPNNYTDMMRLAFKEPIKGSKNEPEPEKKNVQKSDGFYTPDKYWRERDTYFRNFGVEGSEEAFQFSINIIVHLLTRFQERIMFSS
ncbi:MAG: DUF4159 domain-containing protein [Verrucomicrobiota bacterium]